MIIPLIIFFDQATKKVALSKLKAGEVVSCCHNVVKLTLVKNPGAAFGILKSRQLLLKIITVSIIVVLAYFLIYFTIIEFCITIALSLAFVLGGAAGNLIDRFRFSYVVDFFTFKFNGCPVLNFADVFIFLGAIIFATNTLF
ncbi:MAG TPA: signal peptidase II [Clostridiaceae bacterium]|nr:signal peptidase II [Clostridiaceae bacterium]